MELKAVKEENHLRKWLAERVSNWNVFHGDKVKLEWIEPGIGSTAGIPDCGMTYQGQTWRMELKHWYTLSSGVQYKVRPIQRRYHHVNFRAGQKTLIMATIVNKNYNELTLIRGDNVPLRDYCSMFGSGCERGIIETKVPVLVDERAFDFIVETLAAPAWWQ